MTACEAYAALLIIATPYNEITPYNNNNNQSGIGQTGAGAPAAPTKGFGYASRRRGDRRRKPLLQVQLSAAKCVTVSASSCSGSRQLGVGEEALEACRPVVAALRPPHLHGRSKLSARHALAIARCVGPRQCVARCTAQALAAGQAHGAVGRGAGA